MNFTLRYCRYMGIRWVRIRTSCMSPLSDSFFCDAITLPIVRLNTFTEYTRLDFHERDERTNLDIRVCIYLPEHMHVCTHCIRVDWINSNRYREYRYYYRVSVIQSLLLKPQSRSVPKKPKSALSSFLASYILLSRLKLCSTLTSELAYPVSDFITTPDWWNPNSDTRSSKYFALQKYIISKVQIKIKFNLRISH